MARRQGNDQRLGQQNAKVLIWRQIAIGARLRQAAIDARLRQAAITVRLRRAAIAICLRLPVCGARAAGPGHRADGQINVRRVFGRGCGLNDLEGYLRVQCPELAENVRQ